MRQETNERAHVTMATMLLRLKALAAQHRVSVRTTSMRRRIIVMSGINHHHHHLQQQQRSASTSSYSRVVVGGGDGSDDQQWPCSTISTQSRRRWSSYSVSSSSITPVKQDVFRVSFASSSPSSLSLSSISLPSSLSHYSTQSTTTTRKHFWDRDELSRMTNHIIALLVDATMTTKTGPCDDSSAIFDTKNTLDTISPSLGNKQSSNSSSPSSTSTSTSSNKNNYILLLQHRNQLNINHCFDILEAWMELSKVEGQQILRQKQWRRQGARRVRGGLDSAHEARRLLYAMERAATSNNNNNNNSSISRNNDVKGEQPSFMAFVAHELKPSFYNVVLQAYAVSGGRREAATSAQALLKHMIDQCRNYIRQEEEKAAAAASIVSGGNNILLEVAQQRIRPPSVEPMDRSYNIVINCWAKSEEKDAGFKAEEIIDLMNKWRSECLSLRQSSLSLSHYYRGSQPNEITIVSTIDAWSRSRHPAAPDKAMKLWNEGIKLRMEQQQQQQQSSSSPAKGVAPVGSGPILFNATIGVWVRSGRGKEGMIRAEEILRHMIRLHEMGVNSGDNNNINSNNKAASSKTVWPLPDTATYNMILSGWADCEKTLQGIPPGEGAERAEQVLRNLLGLFRETGGGGGGGHGVVKPNRRFFTSCITAWARAAGHGVLDAPERAQQLWDKLVAMYQESECCDADLAPDTESANAVIDAWARALHRPDAMAKAQQVVDQLRAFSKPDLITFNTILDGMGKRGMGKEAVGLLEWLEKESSSSGGGDSNRLLHPDDTSYNNVLADLAIEGGPDSSNRVLAILDRMDQLGSMPGRWNIRPSVVSFTIALTAWEQKCSNNGKGTIEDVKQAKMIMEKMLYRYTQEGDKTCKPDVRFWTKLIHICANVNATTADEQKHALDIVLDAITAVEEITTTSTTTLAPSFSRDTRRHMSTFYEVSLLALSKLCDNNPAQKTHLMQTHFDTCSKDGYVSQKVVECMGGGHGNDATGGGGEHASSIFPVLRPEWSRNVPTRNRPMISATVDQNV